MTERSATIAATPIAMQMKKNSSRLHDARVSRTAIEIDELHVCSTTAPSRRTMRASATAASSRSWVTRTSVVCRGAMDALQQLEDVAAVGGIQVARRLVGEQDRRVVGERAGERDALLLAAGQLRRIVMPAIGQADLVQQPARAAAASGAPAISIGTEHVLVGGQRRNQVKELEHEADLLAAQLRQRVLVEPGDVDAVDHAPSRTTARRARR